MRGWWCLVVGGGELGDLERFVRVETYGCGGGGVDVGQV